MKRRVGIERVVFQLERGSRGSRGSRGWEVVGPAGHAWVRFQLLRAVTVPGERGVPAGWLGGDALTGAIGTRNGRLGKRRSGSRAMGASLRRVPAELYYV